LQWTASWADWTRWEQQMVRSTSAYINRQRFLQGDEMLMQISFELDDYSPGALWIAEQGNLIVGSFGRICLVDMSSWNQIHHLCRYPQFVSSPSSHAWAEAPHHTITWLGDHGKQMFQDKVARSDRFSQSCTCPLVDSLILMMGQR
jgi:hypothetical protein